MTSFYKIAVFNTKVLKTAVVGLVIFASSSWANTLQVKLAEPVWQLMLNNTAIAQRTAAVSPVELGFSRQLQPLLQQKDYKAIAELFNQRPLQTDSAALQVLRGQVLLSLQRYDDAVTALQAALKQQPDLALAHQAISLVFMQQQQYTQARPHLVAAINLGVADAQVYGQLAFINLQTAQPASAVAGYQQALMLEPDNNQWQQGLLYALIQSQAWPQAQAMLEQLLQQQPDNKTLWLQRSQLALSQGNSNQALSSIEVALRLGENSAENLLLAAQLHLAHGSAEHGVSLLQRAIIAGGNKSDAWHTPLLQAVQYLAYQQQWPALRRLLQKPALPAERLTVKQQSQLALVQAQLATADKQPKQALKALQQAVALDPLAGDAILALAQWYETQGNIELASINYSRAATISEVKLSALQRQAQLEINRQQYQIALRLLQQVRQLAPQRQDIADNIRSLQQLVRQQS
ncbi:tetratricopeptide repeat protein [Rheinheimera sp. D18]|uniref:tetratricopeptide repeat protein n=1 Tax=Rheinheimera sp. D18 TaxID=2545632 RepID=UPI0010528C6A|nr:tetratricopeptide repeat protein [Rheinheimera sp. D18]QBL08166.1 tetratricopeptide repeat protein [Rheinheimera sp. D18]